MKRFALIATISLALLAAFALPASAHSTLHTAHCKAMPQTTQRQQIVDVFKTRLAAIDSAVTLADGYKYQTDLGQAPITEWPVIEQSEDLPAVGVYDVVEKRAKVYPDQKAVESTLELQTRVFFKRQTDPGLARLYLADILRAISTDPTSKKRDLRLGGLAFDITATEIGFVVPKETFQIDGAAITWAVETVIGPYDA